MKTNKICFVDPCYYKIQAGGAELQVHFLAKLFLEKKWIVYRITRASNKQFINDDEGLKYLYLKESNSLENDYIAFKKLCIENDLNLFYQRGRKRFTYFVGRYTKETSTVSIFSLSSDNDCYKRTLLKDVISITNNPLKIIKTMLSYYFKGKRDKDSFFGMKHMTKILCQTNYQKDVLYNNCKLRSELLENLWEINNDSYSERNIFKVIWIANIKKLKRPEIYLDLVDQYNSKYSNNVQFYLVGALQNTKYQELIKQYSNKYSNFFYLGKKKYFEIDQLLKEMCLLVNTSIYEGFSNTFVQAWLKGVPVISFGVNPDYILTKKNVGFVVKDIDKAICIIRELTVNQEKYTEMSKNCIRFSKNKFSPKNVYDKLEKIIEDL